MIALLTLTILFKSVLSLPVTQSMLEHDDVKVMKCVVDALMDVLSRPRHLPVSQECLHTLRTDDHLLTLLRHSNFLKELQDVATQGGDERARPPGGGAIAPHHEMPAPQNADGVPDGSMLNALGGSGERSIVSQEPRRSKEEEEQEEEADKGGEDEKREDDDEREEEDNKVWTSEEQRRTVSEEEEEEEEGMKKRSKGFLLGKKSGSAEEEGKEEAPHHSKEVSEEEEVKRKRNRSPEEKELQMIARRTPEEEDGSAARKSEDPEVESLAAIESELENVSQKLHQLRRG